MQNTTRTETLEIYGNPKDPEIQNAINRAYLGGRKVVVKPAPDYATHHGPCGRVCSCKHECAMSFKTPMDL